MTHRVAIVSLSPVDRDARVLRQVTYLSRKYNVTVIGYGQLNGFPSVKMITIPMSAPFDRQAGILGKIRRRIRTHHLFAPPTFLLPSLLAVLERFATQRLGRLCRNGLYDSWCLLPPGGKAAFHALINSRAEIIHANDWNTLPIAVRAAKAIGAQVVLDLHEYAPLHMDHLPNWKTEGQPVIDFILRKYSPKAAATITVNEVIADRYASEYGFRPIVVMNAPDISHSVCFRPTDPRRIGLIHHGGATVSRKLNLMIESVARADTRFSLHFMLVDNSDYVTELKALGERQALNRVFFHPPVATTDVVQRISEFDIGIYILPFTSSNHRMALPNKFFDFINAGLAVCVGPSPEMSRLTLQYRLGVVTPTFGPEQVAETLNTLSAEDIDRMKRQSLLARRDLNADVEMSKLLAIYEKLLSEKN